MAKVVMSPASQRDLIRIGDYLAQQNSRKAALHVIKKIKAREDDF